MTDLNQISTREIGHRLRLARENAGIKQATAAKILGLSRPSLVSIEQGRRPIRQHELQTLAKAYGLSANSLLRREAAHTTLIPRFRRLMGSDDVEAQKAVDLMNSLVKADVELENILGIKPIRHYPPEYGISEGDVVKLGQEHAIDLRKWLNIGLDPITDIFSLAITTLGIRVFQRPLSSKSKISGLYAYDEACGACILLNSNHPRPRRAFSLAHELGHFVSARQNLEVLETESKSLSREERYANSFARSFMMPEASFSQSYRRLTEGMNMLTRRHVIILANQYGTSLEATVRRLEELNLAPKGSWQWFQNNGGIPQTMVRDILGEENQFDSAKLDGKRPIPLLTSLKAYEVWRQNLISEKQLAELFHVTEAELRKVLQEIEGQECNVDNGIRIQPFNFFKQ